MKSEAEHMMAERIRSLKDITPHYDVILCDVWGVLHNGIDPFLQASEALADARRAGASVVLITNSPRPNDSVAIQLDGIGVPRDAWDRIVTSGDVTRGLIRQGPPNVYFLGADRDLGLLDGTDAFPVKEKDAAAIVCTGFFDDETETPEDYRDQLTRFADRNIPMICANPDFVVERGERLIPCAGAVAALYETLGGETRIAGKPHRPIYEEALRRATELREMIDPARVVAIGDGMPTDVRGALSEGLDLLYISAGIHGRDYMTGDVTDERALNDFLASHQADPRWWMPRLA
jgi:HAD superfamily hydrolase (TIGR01450 family)